MTGPEKIPKTGIEGWIDERIRVALGGLIQPLEMRIVRLRERIRKVQERLQEISSQVDEGSLPEDESRGPPEDSEH